VEAEADLMQVVGTLDPASRIAHLLDRGQEERQENCDDGDDDQEFDERETPSSATR
jgi:hypothetical protein